MLLVFVAKYYPMNLEGYLNKVNNEEVDNLSPENLVRFALDLPSLVCNKFRDHDDN